MFTRVLTNLERKRVKAYLRTDGERESVIRALASRTRRHLPQIRQDLELLERLMETYERSKGLPKKRGKRGRVEP